MSYVTYTCNEAECETLLLISRASNSANLHIIHTGDDFWFSIGQWKLFAGMLDDDVMLLAETKLRSYITGLPETKLTWRNNGT